jgi:hypothetical protein
VIRRIPTGEAGEWNRVVSVMSRYDFYHLPCYHALAEEQGEGTAFLYVYSEGDWTIGLPLLLRPVNEVQGLQACGGNLLDATSVYGYAGPIASHSWMPESVMANFRSVLRRTLESEGVVSVFSRLHPLLDQTLLLSGLGETPPSGQTVSIDLKLPSAEQRAQFRANHKTGINRLKRAGVSCLWDRDRRYQGQFTSIYRETMERVGARSDYFFSDSYFEKLFRCEGFEVNLFVALLEGEPISAGLFTVCNGIVQYHLGGTRNDNLQIAPMKLIFDTVRTWATDRCLDVFHLGGGLGGGKDSLFHFKSGFSDRRHSFSTWRWILLPDQYRRLNKMKDDWNRANSLRCSSSGFFPYYRCPAEPAGAAIAAE